MIVCLSPDYSTSDTFLAIDLRDETEDKLSAQSSATCVRDLAGLQLGSTPAVAAREA